MEEEEIKIKTANPIDKAALKLIADGLKILKTGVKIENMNRRYKFIPEENNIFIREKVAQALKTQRHACTMPHSSNYN